MAASLRHEEDGTVIQLKIEGVLFCYTHFPFFLLSFFFVSFCNNFSHWLRITYCDCYIKCFFFF